jgi:hypothetical protein
MEDCHFMTSPSLEKDRGTGDGVDRIFLLKSEQVLEFLTEQKRKNFYIIKDDASFLSY